MHASHTNACLTAPRSINLCASPCRARMKKFGDTMSEARGLSNLLRRAIVGVTRAGLSVRGSRELHVADQKGATLRALVFVTNYDGRRFVVAPRPQSTWVHRLRRVRDADLCCGSKTEHVLASEVFDEQVRIVRAFEGQVPTLLRPQANASSTPVVFQLKSR